MRDLMVDFNNFTMDIMHDVLENIGNRQHQAVVLVYMTHPYYGMEHANTPIPDFLLTDQLNITRCKDKDGINELNYPDFDNEDLLVAIEQLTAELGRLFNGDPRVFSMVVGWVGKYGIWQLGTPAARPCPLPNPASAERMIAGMAKAFDKSFVLMPSSWEAPLFDYAAHPNIGIYDYSFGGSQDLPRLLSTVGLQDRWKTAPVISLMEPSLESCWFHDNATKECAALGISTNVPSFAEVAGRVHPTAVVVTTLFTNYKDDINALQRIQTAFYSTGAYYHLSSVSLQTSPAGLRICAAVENVGSHPFNAPRSLTLVMTIHDDVYELTSDTTPLSSLTPNSPVAYHATAPWDDETDECTNNTVCDTVGQTYVSSSVVLRLVACSFACECMMTSLYSTPQKWKWLKSQEPSTR
ncbi:hypothetical protein DIPPA_33874 [Diplonema papillatum]|nr:hypothetical protein DIPPA_33874 [Diplonema papillatum]